MKEYIGREAARAKLILQDELYAADIIKAMPAADVVERKRGCWITAWVHGDEYQHCTECGAYVEGIFFANDYDVNFCPSCGADMRRQTMDRLTERNKLGEALLNANLNEKYYPSELIDILLDRLAAYEDTGLSPEEIREMMTDWLVWKQAETEGRLVVLPFMRSTENALDLIRAERSRQNSLWGDQSGNQLYKWMSILGEEYGELCEAVNETCARNPRHPEHGGCAAIVREAVQIAAVAVQIIEANIVIDQEVQSANEENI